MTFDTEVPWHPTDSKLFERGENIGLPPEEYDSWKRQGFTVLEVGTGTHASALRSIKQDGINIIGIEPGMNYTGGSNSYRELREDVELNKLVAPLNAVDAADHPLMPKEGVDVVFAQNANFAQYSGGKSEFFNQLHGLVRCLKKENSGSYVTFESSDSDFIFTAGKGENLEQIDLPKVLTDIGARWEPRENKNQIKYIVIYRTNENGEDISDKLEKLI